MAEEPTAAVEPTIPVDPAVEPAATPAVEPATDPATPDPVEPAAPSFDWADMRAQLTGGDESLEKIIGRYRSADAFAKAFLAQRQKLSERVETSVPKIDADSTPEQIAEYRQLMGIPDDVADYGVDFGEGFEAMEEDAGVLDAFKAHMHENNVPPQAAQAAVEWYQGLIEGQRQEQNERADQVHQEASDALKVEWGREFEANQNAIRQYLDQSLGADKAEEIRSMRLMDGSMLMDNPDVLRMLVQPSVDYMGGDMMIAGDSATMAKTLGERRDELLELRLSDPQKYKSDAVQEEIGRIYSQLARVGK